ncbi:VWA domain-containing protein [Streptomyces sp. NPDC090306]|uniref:VWA domain-containing protein n=1 Tax=Streptomyces sp. NPDC090306 TaxID=3365961 RepID=UPI0038245F89
MFFKKKPEPQDVQPAPEPAPAAPPTGAGISLLKETARVSLEKRGLGGLRAAVYLVVDRSYSMAGYFRDGSVQHLADQALGLSAAVDDDGIVPLVFFDSQPYPVVDITLDQHAGVVAQQHQLLGGEDTMGGTRYSLAISTVLEHYQASGATDPALVIFQTDGEPGDGVDAAQLLADAAPLPLFWAFVGFGAHTVTYLTELDQMPGREVDNASYFHAGRSPKSLPDATVYDAITGEFAKWLPQARAKGIVR